MKHRTLIGLIALGVMMVPLLSYIVTSKSVSSGLCDDKAIRSIAEIESQETIYLADMDIALADSSGSNSSLMSEAMRAFDLVNQQRQSAGLPPLSWNPGLESCAAVRASDCASSFSHTRPNGSPWYTVNSAIMAGENLAFGFYDAGSAISAWMNSPTHRENILWPEFSSIAISIYVSDDGTYYWAQEFGY